MKDLKWDFDSGGGLCPPTTAHFCNAGTACLRNSSTV